MWFKKQQLAGFEKGLIPFVSKSDTTKLSAQEIYSLALTVQNMNSYDRQHNAVSVAQQGTFKKVCQTVFLIQLNF